MGLFDSCKSEDSLFGSSVKLSPGKMALIKEDLLKYIRRAGGGSDRLVCNGAGQYTLQRPDYTNGLGFFGCLQSFGRKRNVQHALSALNDIEVQIRSMTSETNTKKEFLPAEAWSKSVTSPELREIFKRVTDKLNSSSNKEAKYDF